MLQIGFFVASVAPWHHTHRVRLWQGRRGGQNPERTPHFYSENSEEPQFRLEQIEPQRVPIEKRAKTDFTSDTVLSVLFTALIGHRAMPTANDLFTNLPRQAGGFAIAGHEFAGFEGGMYYFLALNHFDLAI